MDLKLLVEIIWNNIIRIFTIGTLIGIIIWGFKMCRGWAKYKKEINLNRSKELVKDFQNIKVTLNEYLKDGLKLEVKSYPTELIEHLKDDAYKDKKPDEMGDRSVIGNIERRDFYINKLHNEELKSFYNDLQNNIIYCIRQKNFIECDDSRSMVGQINYFNKETIKLDILKIIQNNYRAPTFLRFWINPHDTFNDLNLQNTNNIWVVSDDEHKKELEDIMKELVTIFDEAINKKFYLFLWYYSEIRGYQTHINERLKRLPLEGKCKKCPKKDSFWRYTWQRIDKYLQ